MIRTRTARTLVASVAILIVLVAVLVYWAMHPYWDPAIYYGFTPGVPFPYHPIPCGLWPLGH